MAQVFKPNLKGIWTIRTFPGVRKEVSKVGEAVTRDAVLQAKEVGKIPWRFSDTGRGQMKDAVMRFEEDYTTKGKRPRSAIIAHHPSGKGRAEGRRAIKRAVKAKKASLL